MPTDAPPVDFKDLVGGGGWNARRHHGARHFHLVFGPMRRAPVEVMFEDMVRVPIVDFGSAPEGDGLGEGDLHDSFYEALFLPTHEHPIHQDA